MAVDLPLPQIQVLTGPVSHVVANGEVLFEVSVPLQRAMVLNALCNRNLVTPKIKRCRVRKFFAVLTPEGERMREQLLALT